MRSPRKTSARKKTSFKEPAKTLELTIESLTHDGRGMARDQGKVFFVEGALPDEHVKARVVKTSKKFNEAQTLEVLEASEQRVEPLCPIFSRCGGCSLQYMPADMQLQAKQDAVLSQLQRWSKITPQTLMEPISGAEYHYRQRVRLAVKYNKRGEFQMGFREAASHRLVDIQECAVLDPLLQPILPLLRQWLGSIDPNIVSHIECLFVDNAIGLVVRHVRHLGAPERQKLLACLKDVPQAVSCWFQGGKGSELENEQGEPLDPRMSYTLDANVTLLFHPQDFIQSNQEVNKSMVRQAVTWMAPSQDKYYLDLFCGIGNFSLALAQRAGRVCGIEGALPMVQRATKNSILNQLDNTCFLERDLASPEKLWDSVLSDVKQSGYRAVEGVLLDPPRAGAKEVCQKIGELAPKRVVYVSCDSSTFARDAGILASQGYGLVHLGVMDMFPQTAHIEVMGLFEINN